MTAARQIKQNDLAGRSQSADKILVSVTAEENQTGSREQLEQLSLARRFRAYSKDDLLVSRSWMVSSAAAAQPEFAKP